MGIYSPIITTLKPTESLDSSKVALYVGRLHLLSSSLSFGWNEFLIGYLWEVHSWLGKFPYR